MSEPYPRGSLEEQFHTGEPVVCRCGCHDHSTKRPVGLHFRPCCKPCPKCRVGFTSGLDSHVAACPLVDDWWAEPVKTIYREAVAELGGNEDAIDAIHFGPGHIAWADGNFDDHSVDVCLGECDRTDPDAYWLKRGPAVLDVNRRALVQLKAIPEEVRDCDPYEED